MTYKVIGILDGTYVSAARLLPASAAVLAQRWLDRGYADVQIVVVGADTMAVETFRARYLRRTA